jgi:hypothetical protein
LVCSKCLELPPMSIYLSSFPTCLSVSQGGCIRYSVRSKQCFVSLYHQAPYDEGIVGQYVRVKSGWLGVTEFENWQHYFDFRRRWRPLTPDPSPTPPCPGVQGIKGYTIFMNSCTSPGPDFKVSRFHRSLGVWSHEVQRHCQVTTSTMCGKLYRPYQ